MIKLLIGGSPCTYWSIAQKNGREVEAKGIGWELFKNYLIAKDKFKPDYFLYENNKSAAQPIKDQISKELGVDLMYINSALVSAQNRQRFYAFNWNVQQPEDRGILLKDILETGEDLTGNDKSFCITSSYGGAVAWNSIERNQRNMVAEPVRVGDLPNAKGEISGSQATRIYGIDGKSVNLVVNGGGQGAKTTSNGKSQTIKAQYQNTSTVNICCYSSTYGATGVAELIGFAIAVEWNEDGEPIKARSGTDGKIYTVYKVENGIITINGKQYEINLDDGYYIIRKLTVKECCRLQTLPDDYCRAVSNSQAYKGLGNGWTAEVIIHILNGALKDIPRDEEIVVLSMYDGIGTGRYCLDKMGFTNIKYYAYEIDKYARAIALSNYPDIIQCGDAFQVREDNWTI